MKAVFLSLTLFMGLAATPIFTAHADEVAVATTSVIAEPGDLEQAIGFIPTIIAAAKASNWLLFGALVSLVLTFVVKKYILPKAGLGNGVLPWVSVLLGLLAGVGGAVAAGANLENALLAVLSGPVASSLWEMIVQYFTKKD